MLGRNFSPLSTGIFSVDWVKRNEYDDSDDDDGDDAAEAHID
jgi:hypothetical protein